MERFEEAMRRLRDLGDVIDESSSGEDVTEEFVDLQSRLGNLEVTRERLREHLDAAESLCQRSGIDYVLCPTDRPLEHALHDYLSARTAHSTNAGRTRVNTPARSAS